MEHQIRAAEIKALKQISFPDMDSDGLPSAYTIKVVTCIGKWQMKMTDLSTQLDVSIETMKPSPGCRLFLIKGMHSIEFCFPFSGTNSILIGSNQKEIIPFLFSKFNLNAFDVLSGWQQRLRA